MIACRQSAHHQGGVAVLREARLHRLEVEQGCLRAIKTQITLLMLSRMHAITGQAAWARRSPCLRPPRRQAPR